MIMIGFVKGEGFRWICVCGCIYVLRI